MKQISYSYENFLQEFQKVNPVVYAILKPHAQALEFSPESVIFGFKSYVISKMFVSKLPIIKSFLFDYFGKTPEVKWRLISSDFSQQKGPENSKKKWTKKDKKFLKENYATLPNEVLAEQLHRTPAAVQLQASVIGVKKNPVQRKRPKPITVVTELDWSDIKKPDLKGIEQRKNIQTYFMVANIVLNLLTLFILMILL